MEPVLQVKHLKKCFPLAGTIKQVLDDVSFSVQAGECLGIVGRSGCGKSTAVRIVARLLPADEGQILLCGEDITRAEGEQLKWAYQRMQMVFQLPEDSFDPRKTLGWSIGEPLRNTRKGTGTQKGADAAEKMGENEIRERVGQLLTDVGLTSDYADRYPHEVSGGECQRAAIARGIALSPRLLICDEVTSALDVTVQSQVVALLRRLCREKGIACLFITHDIALLPQIADRVAVMHGGRIVEQGTVSQVLDDPQSPHTKELLAANFFELEVERRVESYWDERSRDFSETRRRELEGPDAKAWEQLVAQHLPAGEGLRILDVGTGAGFFAILLARLGHQVTAIDMSDAMLREAEENLAAYHCRAKLCRMNAQELAFRDGTFDAVISRNLTWTLPDAMQAYREWSRVLKRGGVLLNFDSDWGTVQFEKTEDPLDVHSDISQRLLEECNSIKESLRISTHRRPAWDAACLEMLGFSVECDPDIASLVHLDPSMRYDPIPLFGIYARKI